MALRGILAMLYNIQVCKVSRKEANDGQSEGCKLHSMALWKTVRMEHTVQED